MLVQDADINVNAVERVELGLELVVSRQKLLAECGKDDIQLIPKLGDIHQLALFLGQLEELELSINALGHDPLSVQVIRSVKTRVAGCRSTQPIDVCQPDFVEGFALPVINPEGLELLCDRRLADAKMIGNLFLRKH